MELKAVLEFSLCSNALHQWLVSCVASLATRKVPVCFSILCLNISLCYIQWIAGRFSFCRCMELLVFWNLQEPSRASSTTIHCKYLVLLSCWFITALLRHGYNNMRKAQYFILVSKIFFILELLEFAIDIILMGIDPKQQYLKRVLNRCKHDFILWSSPLKCNCWNSERLPSYSNWVHREFIGWDQFAMRWTSCLGFSFIFWSSVSMSNYWKPGICTWKSWMLTKWCCAIHKYAICYWRTSLWD